MPRSLAADQLYRRTDPATLGFRTTQELPPLAAALGQDAGIRALEFGVSMLQPGYNVFVLGESGSGRRTFVRAALDARAAAEPTPPDWCYVQNFQDPRRPRAVSLSAGRAAEFRSDLGALIADLRRAIPQMLDSEAANSRRNQASETWEGTARDLLEALREDLQKDGYVALRETDRDYVLAPARGGEPLSQEAYAQLPEALRTTIDEHVARIRAVTVADVARVLHRVLEGPRALAAVGPFTAEELTA